MNEKFYFFCIQFNPCTHIFNDATYVFIIFSTFCTGKQNRASLDLKYNKYNRTNFISIHRTRRSSSSHSAIISIKHLKIIEEKKVYIWGLTTLSINHCLRHQNHLKNPKESRVYVDLELPQTDIILRMLCNLWKERKKILKLIKSTRCRLKFMISFFFIFFVCLNKFDRDERNTRD